tara:strand:+ start:159 stop:308 length:150 start_codon:yes stop_codon:yes gene_type:complete
MTRLCLYQRVPYAVNGLLAILALGLAAAAGAGALKLARIPGPSDQDRTL